MGDELGVSVISKGRMDIKFTRSCYISNRSCPTLDNVNSNGSVHSKKPSDSNIRRVNATHEYYGSSLGRFDNIFLRSPSNTQLPDDIDEVWFGKVLSFVTIESSGRLKQVSTEKCGAHNVENCSSCFGNVKGTYAFVQDYDVVNEDEVPIDEIDKQLNCIRLKWAWSYNEIEESVDCGKQYGLCHIDSILGVTHLVPAFEILRGLNNNSTYKTAVEKNIGPQDRWEGQLFYVNRYYRDFSNDNWRNHCNSIIFEL